MPPRTPVARLPLHVRTNVHRTPCPATHVLEAFLLQRAARTQRAPVPSGQQGVERLILRRRTDSRSTASQLRIAGHRTPPSGRDGCCGKRCIAESTRRPPPPFEHCSAAGVRQRARDRATSDHATPHDEDAIVGAPRARRRRWPRAPGFDESVGAPTGCVLRRRAAIAG